MRKIERELRREFPEAEIEVCEKRSLPNQVGERQDGDRLADAELPVLLAKVRADVRRAMNDP